MSHLRCEGVEKCRQEVKCKVVPTCRGLKLRRHADVSRADMSMFKVAMSDMSRRVSRRRHVEDQLKATS